ncbi:AmmeMemoRadiSam system protein A [Alkaliphilus transvaalensis]|uniref:AmmeMemoRadiSam system protein A n=1 Tax=Alkaliphilus transvaalensis TaxID=114628 RepID=UPI00047C1D2B|nr:AmmeMemoRadiSam system protein A [Alkaliphilus transvaalensis]
MGNLLGVVIVPHPPIILPLIGQGEEDNAKATIVGLQEIASLIKEKAPEMIICITPHGNVFDDGICILDENAISGNLGEFGAEEIKIEKALDQDFIDRLVDFFLEKEVPSVFLSKNLAKEYATALTLDHGTMIPLCYIDQEYSQYKLVHITIGMMELLDLYEIGTFIRSVIEDYRKSALLLISGDLSHALSEDAPAGYHPEAKEFDHLILQSLKNGKIEDLLWIPDEVSNTAAECGLRPIIMGLGFLDGYRIDAHIHSYEAPFGVGYLNASIEANEVSESLLAKMQRKRHLAYLGKKRTESIPVSLARATIEEWVGKGQQLDWETFQELILQKDFVYELDRNRAGVFVSVYKKGDLRGCMGTYTPNQQSIAEEIIHNAIMAVTEDPRFYPLRKNELKDIEIKVDILHKLVRVESIEELDAKKYGIYIEGKGKSSLLLPNLEGVETPKEQIEIAREKADIGLAEEIDLYRFEVTRYE